MNTLEARELRRARRFKTVAQVVTRMERLCNSDPYTSGQMESVMRNIGHLADRLDQIRHLRRSVEPAIKRLKRQHSQLADTGGPYAPMIRQHLIRSVWTLRRGQ